MGEPTITKDENGGSSSNNNTDVIKLLEDSDRTDHSSSVNAPEHLSSTFLESTRAGGTYFDKTELSKHHRKRKNPIRWQSSAFGKLVAIISFWLIVLHGVGYIELTWQFGVVFIVSVACIVLAWKQIQILWFFSYKKVKKSIYSLRKPKRIIIIRHGQSEGNVDKTIYGRKPDNKISLTEKGREEARQAGKSLRSVIPEDETVRFFISPYQRTKETFQSLLEGWKLPRTSYTTRIEPRLREQDWGNFQDPQQISQSIKDRRQFGSFYFRFINGESGADVFTRVDSFWSSLYREFKYQNCLENFVLVTHGITFRLFLMRYFKWTVEEYHKLWNPENCQYAVLSLNKWGQYQLTHPLKRNQ